MEAQRSPQSSFNARYWSPKGGTREAEASPRLTGKFAAERIDYLATIGRPLCLHSEITPIVNEPCTHHLSTRRDQSVFNRCRIGHSRLTHEFLLKGEPPPECIPCNCPLTIKHLLIECVDFNDVRQRFYQVPTLQDLFKTVKPEVILDFLKAAALYRLL